MKKITILLIICLTLSCLSTPESQDVINLRDELRSERSYIDDKWFPATGGIYDYAKECIEGVQGAIIYPIWFNSLNTEMNGIIFTPEISNGESALVIHGYAGNIRGLRKVISHLLKSGYTVAAYTLPGHSLSGGRRGDIVNFDNYGEVVNDFVTQLKGKIPKINYAVGHSTGCSSLIIYNEKYGWDFDGVLFIAPLIRSYSWYPAEVARFLSSPFIDELDTAWKGPFAVQTFPFHWFDQLKHWNYRNRNYKKQYDNIVVFQGKEDKVVSWRYNINFIMDLYPNSEVYLYDEADHIDLFLNEPFLSKLLSRLDIMVGNDHKYVNKLLENR